MRLLLECLMAFCVGQLIAWSIFVGTIFVGVMTFRALVF